MLRTERKKEMMSETKTAMTVVSSICARATVSDEDLLVVIVKDDGCPLVNTLIKSPPPSLS